MSKIRQREPTENLWSDETAILNFYNLPDANPAYWIEDPADQEENDLERRSVMPGIKDRVPLDEPDPLNRLESVIEAKGLDPSSIPVKERAQLMISSRAFNARTFLAKVHDDATYDELARGTEYLRISLEQRSGALKGLVEKNFDRFVSAKSTIDMLYREMQEKTLNKQADYGVGDLKNILTNASNKADKVFGTVLENKTKAEKIRSTVSVLAKYKFFFDLPSSLRESLKQNKFDAALHDYKRGKYFFQSIGEDAERRTSVDPALTNDQLASLSEQQKKVFDKVWNEAERIMLDMQQTLFERLTDPDRPVEEHEKFIDTLLELETSEDPIWFYLDNRFTYFSNLLKSTFKEQTNEIQLVAHRCLKEDAEKTLQHNQQILRDAIKNVNSHGLEALMAKSDMQMWKVTLDMVKVMINLLMRCLPDLNKTSKAYIEGKFAKTSTTSLLTARRKKNGIDSHIMDRCARMPRDLLELFSSLLSDYFCVYMEPKKDEDGETEIPPPFVPANTNAISTCYFLIKIAQELNECHNEVSALQLGPESTASMTQLMEKTRWSFTGVICTIWARDSKTIYVIEDWTLDPDNKELTMFLRHFYFFHKYCSRIAYKIASPVTKDSNGQLIVPKVSEEYLERIKSTFLDSLYKFLDGMVHLALSEEVVSKDVDTRTLLTVSNLNHLKLQIIGRMVSNFENAWKISMSEDMKVLFDIIKELDQLLFSKFIDKKVEAVAAIIRKGILESGINWAEISKPTEVQAYVYEALLALVIAHSQVNDVAKSLIPRTMATLLEKLSIECLESFQAVKTKFGMGGMLQATLEIEFIHQTLGQYASQEAQRIFQDIYATIQKKYEPARGENGGDFQSELETVKKLLVSCRKSTALQFMCFKQPRSK